MRMGRGIPENGTQTTRGPLLAVAAMLILLPFVMLQGPVHTTAFDAFNAFFIVFYWLRFSVRPSPVTFPMLLPMWLILLGSCVGLYSADDPGRSLVFLGKEMYLYIWFLTAVHFLTYHCRAATVASMWVGIATTLALLMALDSHTHVFGGHIGGQLRGAGTFENPNMCGNYLDMSFFLAWSLAAAGRPRFYIAMPVLVAAVLATASNGALLSLTVGCTVAFSMTVGRRSLLLAGGAGLVVAAIGLAIVGAAHKRLERSSLELMSRGRRSIGGAALEGAGERFPLWLDAADSVQRVPTGVGPGNFNREGGRISGDTHGAHNDYVGMLAERGPLGLIGWCALLVSAAAVLRRLRAARAGGSGELGIEALFGALAAVSLHSMTMESFHFRHLWMFLVLIHAALAQTSPVSFRQLALATPARPAIAEGA
jgi:O-antigen ligase